MKTFKIQWTNLDGTKVLFYPLNHEKPFKTMEECFRYIENARLRLNLSNRFSIEEIKEV